MELSGTGISRILVDALTIARWIIIIHLIMSWLIQFEVLNLRQPIVSQAWYAINRITNPIYARLRRIIPPIAGMDFTPIIVLFGIHAVQVLLISNPF